MTWQTFDRRAAARGEEAPREARLNRGSGRLALTRAAWNWIGQPRQVHLLIDVDNMAFAVSPANEPGPDTFKVDTPTTKGRTAYVDTALMVKRLEWERFCGLAWNEPELHVEDGPDGDRCVLLVVPLLMGVEYPPGPRRGASRG